MLKYVSVNSEASLKQKILSDIMNKEFLDSLNRVILKLGRACIEDSKSKCKT